MISAQLYCVANVVGDRQVQRLWFMRFDQEFERLFIAQRTLRYANSVYSRTASLVLRPRRYGFENSVGVIFGSCYLFIY